MKSEVKFKWTVIKSILRCETVVYTPQLSGVFRWTSDLRQTWLSLGLSGTGAPGSSPDRMWQKNHCFHRLMLFQELHNLSQNCITAPVPVLYQGKLHRCSTRCIWLIGQQGDLFWSQSCFFTLSLSGMRFPGVLIHHRWMDFKNPDPQNSKQRQWTYVICLLSFTNGTLLITTSLKRFKISRLVF